MSAPTPFSTTLVTYPGQALKRVVDRDPAIKTAYLGLPGNMIEVSPIGAVTSPTRTKNRGEGAHLLLGGGTAMQRRTGVKRAIVLTWDHLRGRDYQILDAFYSGVYGNGPFCLVTGEDRNRLPRSASYCGGLNGDISKWSADVGTLALDSTDVAAVLPSGVLKWTGATTNSLATVGTFTSTTPVPDGPSVTSSGTAIPYLQPQPVTCSLYARAASTSVSLTLTASGRAVDGTVATEVSSSPVTVTSSGWTRITVTAVAGALGTPAYVMPVLKCNTGSAAAILISAAQVEYASAVTDWVSGNHVARVQMAPDGLSEALDQILGKTVSITFPEAP